MAKAPVAVRLNGLMAAMFNDAARMRLCESSGSEHYSSDEHSANLSDLVNSFLETDYTNTVQEDHGTNVNHDQEKDSNSKRDEDLRSYCSDSENRSVLQNLLNDNIQEQEDFRTKIQEIASGIIEDRSSHGFKRRLVSQLREHGFDAGLCKTRWGKFGRHPPGEYEYVDVNVDGNRFIIEVVLAREFEIARPTPAYTTLLDYFPQVFVGKGEELKQIVRLMCNEMRLSMKEMNLHVPPWRRNGYMQAKWFGPYKRTINEIPTKNKPLKSDESFAAKRSVVFETSQVKAYNCRDSIISQVGLKVGLLTAAFNGSS